MSTTPCGFRHPAGAPCLVATRGQRCVRSAWLFGVLIGAASCNALLGIQEASLTCAAPACELADAAATGGNDMTPGSGAAARAPDAGAERAGASLAGAGGAPATSGSRGDVAPVAPSLAPAGDTEPGNGAAASAGSGPPVGGDDAGQGPCSTGDACGDCLCVECEEALGACTSTPGCLEILACARNSGCTGFACYCGAVDLLQCATTDLANGPCLAVMLAAPGSHAPSLLDPNAGPASEAALDLATCSAQSCAVACRR
jgi:hypothetical protein